MRNALMMVGAVFLAFLMALMAGGLTWVLNDARIPFALGMLGFLLLRFLYGMMKLDISDVEKTKWAGSLFSYFFTFLAIWVLLINPPLVDLLAPTIENTTPLLQEEGSEVYISVHVEDNTEIDDVTLFITDMPSGGHLDDLEMTKRGRNNFEYIIPKDNLSIGKYEFEVEVADSTDHTDFKKFSFEVVPQSPPEIGPQGEWNLTQGRAFHVLIKDNVGVVFAWYSYEPNYRPDQAGAKEHKLKLDDPTDSVVSIKYPKDGWISLTVCAMDDVPHTTVCETFLPMAYP
jgi:hypothetical protein